MSQKFCLSQKCVVENQTFLLTAKTKHRHVIAYIKARDMSYPNMLQALPVVAWLLFTAVPKICYAHYNKCYVGVTIRD